jgi:hypothetical protein
VDLWIPDPVQEAAAHAPVDPFGPVRWSAGSVIIAFPIYLLLLRLLRRGYAADPERRLSPVRKWLTSVTLFIAAAVLIGDGVTLVSSLLGGEFTARFLLKTLVVGGVAAAVIGCYIWDLHETSPEPSSGQEVLEGQELQPKQERSRRLVARTAGGAVVLILVTALTLAGSPRAARARAADERRVQALQTISSAIDAYHGSQRHLPASLEKLREQPAVYVESIVDVSTGKPYEYRRLDAKSYQLCATFETDSSTLPAARPRFGNLWNHPAGRHCFKLTVQQ